MIKPSIGRVVLFQPAHQTPGDQPLAALVAYVHNDRLINVGGFDHEGHPFQQVNVPLLQDDDPAPHGIDYAEWMPYQKGQAAKTEAAEAKLAATTPEAPKSNFRLALEHAIAASSRENGSNTPDFILADYLGDCLRVFDQAVMAREQWYGRSASAEKALADAATPLVIGKLPSQFQIGDDVCTTGGTHRKVTGVQFTEGKVHYLLDDEEEPWDSAMVGPA